YLVMCNLSRGVQWLHDDNSMRRGVPLLMPAQTRDDACYTLEEGHVVLDFINTSYIVFDDAAPYGYRPTDESLTDLPALAAWGAQIGLLEPSDVATLEHALLPNRLA